jgi:hypothetical protein
MTAAQVHVDLPQTWVPVPVAPDGDPDGQRQLLAEWLGDRPPPELVRLLVRTSRQADCDGVSFAAVLLGSVDGAAVGVDRVVLSAALTIGFRGLPGSANPRVAAEGVLQVLRRSGGPTRRASLVGLAGDPDRPAVLVTEHASEDGRLLARTQVLWLVPGSHHLAGVVVTSEDLPLAAALRDVALGAAVSLRVGAGVAPVNA